MRFFITRQSCSKLHLIGALTFALSVSTSITAQDINITPPGGGTPIQRGLGEALRGATQGGNIGDSIRRGVGEAARSAIETPDQTLRRDQDLQLRQQLEAQQRFESQQGFQSGQFGAPYRPGYSPGVIYRDDWGRTYYLNEQGNRVYTQQHAQIQPYHSPQGTYRGQTHSTQPGASASTQASLSQGPSLGVTLQPVDRGIRILSVRPGSAAEQARLQSGDVIRSVNGRQITTVQSLVQSVRDSAGGQMDIQFERNGRQQHVAAMIMDPNSTSTHSMAKPILEGHSDQSALVDQLTSLRAEIANLRNEVAQLRDKVAPNDANSGIDNSATTPLLHDPVEPAEPLTDTDADESEATDQ